MNILKCLALCCLPQDEKSDTNRKICQLSNDQIIYNNGMNGFSFKNIFTVKVNYQIQTDQLLKYKKKVNLVNQNVKFINEYQMGKLIRVSTFGTVSHASKIVDGNKIQCAMKVISKRKLRRTLFFKRNRQGQVIKTDALKQLQKQIAIGLKINHPNFIKLYEIIKINQSDKIYMSNLLSLVYQYADGKQLLTWNQEQFKYISPFTTHVTQQQQIREIFRQIAFAIYYLHINNIVHRDLKPQNILFCKGKVKINDFSVAEIVNENGQVQDIQGTYFFMPPQCFLTHTLTKIKGKPIDMWSVGVCLYCYVYLQLPFDGENCEQLVCNILQQQYIVFKRIHFKEINGFKSFYKFSKLLKSLLNKSPRNRMTIEEMIMNDWLNQDNIQLSQLIQKFIQKQSRSNINQNLKY